jgi:nitrate reductase NapA
VVQDGRPAGRRARRLWQLIAVAQELFDLGHPGCSTRTASSCLRSKDTQGREVPFWDWAHYYDINVDERLFEEYRLLHPHETQGPRAL